MDTIPAPNEIEKIKIENNYLKSFIIKYDISYPIFTTKLLGTTIGNKSFSLPKELYNDWKLYKINIYHDERYTTRIEMFYKDKENNSKSYKFGERDGIKESLEIKDNEVIENLIINAGDLIDGITIDTNKNSLFGRIKNVGGFGHTFNIKEISKIFNKKIELIGFEGNHDGNHIIQTKAIFKFIDN